MEVNPHSSQDAPSKSHGLYYEHKEEESSKSKELKSMFWSIGTKDSKTLENKLKGQASPIEQPEPSEDFKNKFHVTSWQVEGRNVFKIVPKQNSTQKHILYLHGGAYVLSIFASHWGLIEALINQLNCTVIVPDYPLAPNHTYLDSFRFIDPIYKQLISEVNPKDVILIGDSAGGGFALGLAQKLKEDGQPQPSHIILLSPWLDITCTNPELKELHHLDPILHLDGLKAASEAYTKGGDSNSYLVTPINGNLEGLGKISVFTGTHDILWADAKVFKSRCDEKGVAINYYVYPNMLHGWVCNAMPESEHAVQKIKELVSC